MPLSGRQGAYPAMLGGAQVVIQSQSRTIGWQMKPSGSAQVRRGRGQVRLARMARHWRAARLASIRGVQEPGAQLGHDARPGLGRAGQPRRDLGEIALDRRPGTWFLRPWPAHDELTAGGAGCSRAVTAVEKSRQVLRSPSRARLPAGVSS
jgi:hypothetical protein